MTTDDTAYKNSDEATHNVSEHEEHKDELSPKMGMWLFLLTELLLFGGLFLAYMTYRHQYFNDFQIAAKDLNLQLGTLNTLLLLTSSFTMALSVYLLEKAKRNASLMCITLTILFGLIFLFNKYLEWSAEIHSGFYPKSELLLSKPNGQILFFGLYYTMTGLHGMHVIIGVVILSFMMSFIIKNKAGNNNTVKLENSGLYWHLVDLIWIFLFPLFYLLH